MNKLIILLCGLIASQSCMAVSGQAYMNRFNTYLTFSEKLPINPNPEFLEFIQGTTPLSNKLRNKWLYELARKQDWANYLKTYQPTKDSNLTCYEHLAKYSTGADQEAFNATLPLWLNGESSSKICNKLFERLLKDPRFDEHFITQRFALALEKENIQLAHYLLTLFKEPKKVEMDSLERVYKNPNSIRTLNATELNSSIYLYGLKRIISIDMDKALDLWDQIKTRYILNKQQQQEFLTQIALYKAIRTNEDAQAWFAKIEPQYYKEVLVDWQIRFALKRKNWKQVHDLILQAANKDSPCWQYWLARSLEELGNTEEAKTVYEPLAKSRQYYGFLASLRLKQNPSFTNENPTKNLNLLRPYQPFMDRIKQLYVHKSTMEASLLLNDFISELAKDEASALVYWVDAKLQWHEKSIALSNNDQLNDQLYLRFPLAYKSSVRQFSNKYTIPPEFVYAIIRQESEFREKATSSAGARGLMQVMPTTAGLISKENKISYKHKDQLFLSGTNINIGVAYLKQLSKRFSNNPILIAAAYNAGPKQVVNWLKTHPPKEMDVWIETLPWQETRNYLKNVMAFYIVYQYRLKQKPNLNDFLEPLKNS